MNGPGDIPLTHSSTPDTQPCSLISIIPTLGMSSCRGRAEAFARRLSSKLRTLGSQTDEDQISQEDEPIINGGTVNNTWMTAHDSEQTVTDLQPLRHESDSFFDFDCELESPGSPVDECEYLRLIETASNTPHNSAAESGYVCASAASSHSSTDNPYFGEDGAHASILIAAANIKTNTSNAATNTNTNTNITASPTVTTQQPTRLTLSAAELPQYVHALKLNGSNESLSNGSQEHQQTDTNAAEKVQALPITAPKESSNSAQQMADTTTEQNQELTDEQLTQLQDHILVQLQQHSEQVDQEEAQKAQQEATNGHYEEHDEVDSSAANAQHECALQHGISNGHTQNAEEILQIELITNAADKDMEITSVENGTSEELLQPNVTEEKVDEENKEITEQSNATSEKVVVETEPKNTQQPSALDTTDDEDECRPQRVRRCSSLKTGKTPPGTPGRKKIVRFADVLGLDLADVKTFLDEIPTIPKSAFEDLEILESEPPIQLGPKLDKMLMPLFQQPGGLTTFLDLVREKQVSLENAAVTDSINQTITGSVRVRNLDFHKSVHIRYTLDNWRSFADLQANYVENSCDGFSDKFSFVLFGNSMQIGQRLEFAVRFQCKGQQFWDSNYGTNYCFQCLPTSTPLCNTIVPIVPTHHHNSQVTGMLSPTTGDAWCSSFY